MLWTNVSAMVLAVIVLILAIVEARRLEIQRNRDREDLQRQKDLAQQEIEAQRKTLLVEAREDAMRMKEQLEQEDREKRAELQRLERRLTQREETLERKGLLRHLEMQRDSRQGRSAHEREAY